MTPPVTPIDSPWLTAKQAAVRAQVAVRTIYGAVDRGQIRVARIASGRCLRFHRDWVDEWLVKASTPIEIDPAQRKRR